MGSGAADITPINFSGFGEYCNSTRPTLSARLTGWASMTLSIFVTCRSQLTTIWVFNAGTLTLEDGAGFVLASFALSGSYTSADFAVYSASSGGTMIQGLKSTATW